MFYPQGFQTLIKSTVIHDFIKCIFIWLYPKSQNSFFGKNICFTELFLLLQVNQKFILGNMSS